MRVTYSAEAPDELRLQQVLTRNVPGTVSNRPVARIRSSSNHDDATGLPGRQEPHYDSYTSVTPWRVHAPSRHPHWCLVLSGAYPDANFNFDHLRRFARRLEKARFDDFFMADHLAVLNMPVNALKRSHTVTSFEPSTPLSALASVIERIGLVGTASTAIEEPYHIARRFASLDQISGGRAGWTLNPAMWLNGAGRTRIAARAKALREFGASDRALGSA